MKKILFALYIICTMILIMGLLEFIYLDRKLTQAIQEQNKTDILVHATLEQQSKAIRVLESDCLVLTNIIINGDFTEADYE